MDFELIIAAILFTVMVLAAASIGIQFYDNCDALKNNNKMKTNRNYLIAILVMSILATVFFLYQGATHDVTKNLGKKYGFGS